VDIAASRLAGVTDSPLEWAVKCASPSTVVSIDLVM